MSEWSEEGGVISWPVQMQWEVMCKLFTVVWTAAEGGMKWMACAAPGIPTNCCSPDLLCIRWLGKYRWYYFDMQILEEVDQKVAGVLRALCLSIAELMEFLFFLFVFFLYFELQLITIDRSSQAQDKMSEAFHLDQHSRGC